MLIEMYLCLATPAFILGLALFVRRLDPDTRWKTARAEILRFILFSAGLSLGGMILFAGLSAAASILRFGVAYALDVPGDYLERGVIGVMILLVALAGIIAPPVLAVLARRPPGSTLTKA